MFTKRVSLLVLVLAILLGPWPAYAQTVLPPGSPDPSFGEAGLVVTGEIQNLVDMQIGSDGKIVILGLYISTNGDNVFYDAHLERYDASGTRDTSFGSDGSVQTGFPSANFFGPSELILQPDGKIVIAARVSSGGQEGIGLMRLLEDGSLDPSFGDGGTTFLPLGIFVAVGAAVWVEDGPLAGRIVVAGDYEGSEPFTIFLAAFNSTGELDRAWADQGFARKIYPMPPHMWPWLIDMAVSNSGFILVGTPPFGEGLWGMEVFNRDGSYNRSLLNPFEEECVTSQCLGSAYSVGVQADGKILVMGNRIVQVSLGIFNYDTILLRFTSDWELDPSFGDHGSRLYPDLMAGMDIAVQPDGKILFVGSEEHRSVLVRLNPDGSYDTSFGSGGFVDQQYYYRSSHRLELAPDRKIVTAGGNNPRVYLERFISGLEDGGVSPGRVVFRSPRSNHKTGRFVPIKFFFQDDAGRRIREHQEVDLAIHCPSTPGEPGPEVARFSLGSTRQALRFNAAAGVYHIVFATRPLELPKGTVCSAIVCTAGTNNALGEVLFTLSARR